VTTYHDAEVGGFSTGFLKHLIVITKGSQHADFI